MSLDFYLEYEEDGNNIEVFNSNITHNLTTMADNAGIYYALWRPEEIKANKAKDIIPLLKNGLKKLKNKPEYFKKYNAKNGWGTYEYFVLFVEEVLSACTKYPNSKIEVRR